MPASAVATLGLPFASFLVLALVRPLRRSGRPAGLLSIVAIAAAFVLALTLLAAGGRMEASWSWIPADGGPMATVGGLVDDRSGAVLVLITLVSLVVQG